MSSIQGHYRVITLKASLLGWVKMCYLYGFPGSHGSSSPLTQRLILLILILLILFAPLFERTCGYCMVGSYALLSVRPSTCLSLVKNSCQQMGMVFFALTGRAHCQHQVAFFSMYISQHSLQQFYIMNSTVLVYIHYEKEIIVI